MDSQPGTCWSALEECRQHHARLMVVWIPIRQQVDDRRWEDLWRERGLDRESRTRPQELLLKLADGLGFGARDLLPAFR